MISHADSVERWRRVQRKLASRAGGMLTISKSARFPHPRDAGAQIFEAVGLDRELVDRYFTGTPSAMKKKIPTPWGAGCGAT